MKNFDKPLDKEIYEEQEIERNVVEVNPETKHLERKTIKDKVLIKTKYSQASNPIKMTCKNFEHNWQMVDKHTYEAGCTQCRKRLFLRPTEETIIQGKIVSRATKEQIA